jgi:phosphatidylglycerol:prolipoprotein diacylglycerol transferase
VEIDFSPILFSVGPWEFRWYSAILIISAALALLLLLLEAKRLGLSRSHAIVLFLWGIVFKITFAKLFLFVDRWQYYSVDPSRIWDLSSGRLDGGIIGYILLLIIYSQIIKFPFWRLSDLVIPCLAIAVAVGRIGCLINGCCYGITCDLPWAIIYTNPRSYAPLNIPIHPVQLYQAVWYSAVFAAVWLLRKRLKPEGSLFLLFIMLHASGDLATRFFRVDNAFLFGLQQAQVISILMLTVCIPLYIVRHIQYRRSAPDSPSI